MVNLKIRKFEQAIIKFVNESELPIEVKRLCIAEIMSQINAAAEQEVYKEKAQEEIKSCTESEESENGD